MEERWTERKSEKKRNIYNPENSTQLAQFAICCGGPFEWDNLN